MNLSDDIYIQIDNLSVVFDTKGDRVTALENVNLTVKKNEFITFLGPSGCGKTTLLKVINGLTAPTLGAVIVGGEKVERPIANCGMMFQAPTLLKWRKSLKNVLLPAEAVGIDIKTARIRAGELLEVVGLRGFEDRYPRELSGGMQQRVSLARALLLDPPLLLMDEPFGALDALTRDDMGNELVRIWKLNPKTVVFVTHSIREAIALSDRIFVMTPRPGKVAKVFEVIEPRPRDPRKMGDKYNDLIDEIHKCLGGETRGADTETMD